MKGKIGLEEHFSGEDTLMDSHGFVDDEKWRQLRANLLDMGDRRLAEMDRHGMERMIVSLNAPAVQKIHDTKKAIEVARRANDLLAEHIAKRPDRFSGFAALAMQDPEAATRELERCVKQLGFVGALVNGFSNIGSPENAVYLDLKQYWDFWGMVERLDVPFYLHPRQPSQLKAYEGHPWLIGPAYGFAAETALHALRLLGSGLFDKYPKLQLVLGHMGENLPFTLYRTEQRIKWSPMGYPAKKSVREYFQSNVYITTAGTFRTQTLIDCLLEVGADRILFSTDWPFEQVGEAAEWFDATPISDNDKQKIGRTNSLKLFKLKG
ncbi:MAG TPA: amidohydrolase family protein [Alphaproteobacteria bacterium]